MMPAANIEPEHISEHTASSRRPPIGNSARGRQRRRPEINISQGLHNRSSPEPCEPDWSDRIALQGSVKRLSAHLPRCLLNKLGSSLDALLPEPEPLKVQTQTVKAVGQRVLQPSPVLSDTDTVASPVDPTAEALSVTSLSEDTVHQGVLLFVDISGFTKLSTLLGVEDFSRTVNSYFEIITSQVAHHGGDLLRFVGDAVFVEWAVTDCGPTLEQCLLVAATCGARIVDLCSDYEVFASPTSEAKAILNVHCGLGAGDICTIHVGDNESRREVLSLGDAVRQALMAEKDAAEGQLSASPEAFAILREVCDIGQSADSNNSWCPFTIACKSNNLLSPHDPDALAHWIWQLSSMLDQPWIKLEMLDVPTLRCLQRCMSLYVHPVVRYDEGEMMQVFTTSRVASTSSTPSARSAEDSPMLLGAAFSKSVSLPDDPLNLEGSERPASPPPSPLTLASPTHARMQRGSSRSVLGRQGSFNVVSMSSMASFNAQAELRTVCAVFIRPSIDTDLAGSAESDGLLFSTLNHIILVCIRYLDQFGGQLSQYFLDDKGLVLLALFGLKGSTFPNMVSEKALPCAVAIQDALGDELMLDCRIGATLGRSYSGIVGGAHRHQLTVLGPSVNLAARLMMSEMNATILVDDALQKEATTNFDFENLGSMSAKGYEFEVPIFEPYKERAQYFSDAKLLVGRESELDCILASARSVMFVPKASARPEFVLVTGKKGIGKSTLLQSAMQRIKRLCRTVRQPVVMTKTVCLEHEQLVPLSSLRTVFIQVISQFTESSPNSEVADEEGQPQDGHLDAQSLRLNSPNLRKRGSAISVSGLSLASMNESVVMPSDLTNLVRNLRQACRILGKSDEFAEVVGTRFLGLEEWHFEADEWSEDEETGQDKKKELRKERIDKLSSKTDLGDVAEFLAKTFLWCRHEDDLLSIALDDIQYMDSMSATIIQRLCETDSKIILLCAYLPTEDQTSARDPWFWHDWQQEEADSTDSDKGDSAPESELPESKFITPAFTNLHLQPLSLASIRNLVAKTLGNSFGNVDEALCVNLHAQSEGMPFFAGQILEFMKREKRRDQTRRNSLFEGFQNLEEIFLHRLDCLDTILRKTLDFCAILGRSFRLSELKELVPLLCDDSDEDAEKLAHECLNDAVSEGILTEIHSGSTLNDEDGQQEIYFGGDVPSELPNAMGFSDFLKFERHDSRLSGSRSPVTRSLVSLSEETDDEENDRKSPEGVQAPKVLPLRTRRLSESQRSGQRNGSASPAPTRRRSLTVVSIVRNFENGSNSLGSRVSSNGSAFGSRPASNADSVGGSTGVSPSVRSMFSVGGTQCIPGMRKAEFVDRTFEFSHGIWRDVILRVMLDSRKKEMHQSVAVTLEAQLEEAEKKQSSSQWKVAKNHRRDFSAIMKLFEHWVGCENFTKASALALSMGKQWEEWGLSKNSLGVYAKAISMWATPISPSPSESERSPSTERSPSNQTLIAGCSVKVLEQRTAEELESIVKLLIQSARCYANCAEGKQSAEMFQSAHDVLRHVKAADSIQDRTIAFPVISGLGLAFKWGHIQDDSQCTKEQELCAWFVDETTRHGDPVHLLRALAMHSGLLGRVGRFEEAIKVQLEIEKLYSPDDHSEGISKAYGSDRAAQNYGVCTQWYLKLGEVDRAKRLIQFILEEIMPLMEPRSVHNSFMIMYPCVFAMKRLSNAQGGMEMFDKFVTKPCNEHYGEEGSIFSRKMYRPTSTLLGLAGGRWSRDDKIDQFEREKMETWILDEEISEYKGLIYSTCVMMGADPHVVLAEICAELVKLRQRLKVNNNDGRVERLIKKGLTAARGAEDKYTVEEKDIMYAYEHVLEVLNMLEELETQLCGNGGAND